MALSPRWPIWAIFGPKSKRKAKKHFKKRRRQLEQKGLDKMKKIYNATTDAKELDKIDYFTDPSYIKLKSRQGSSAEFLGKRCSGARLTMGIYT